MEGRRAPEETDVAQVGDVTQAVFKKPRRGMPRWIKRTAFTLLLLILAAASFYAGYNIR